MREMSAIVAGGKLQTMGSKTRDAATSTMMPSWSATMPGVRLVLQDEGPLATTPSSVPESAGHGRHKPSLVRKKSTGQRHTKFPSLLMGNKLSAQKQSDALVLLGCLVS